MRGECRNKRRKTKREPARVGKGGRNEGRQSEGNKNRKQRRKS